ncbi:MAG TPA: Yip1 family protein [Steroidobacteraceae bacterium]
MSKLIERAQRILMSPKTEWPVIAAEAETTAGLYKSYIAILAALGPIALFLKSTLIGTQLPFLGTFRLDMGTGLVQLVIGYILSLVSVYVFALIVNALAPTFGGQKDSVQALKTVAYAMTAGWIAGIGQILPWLGVLIGIAGGIYSIYLLYLGLPVTMKSPPDKAAAYTAVSVIAGIILFWICAMIVGGIIGRSMWGGYGVGGPTVGESGGFDKGSTGAAIEEWGKEIEKAGKQVERSAAESGGVPTGAAIGQLMGAVVGGKKGVDALPTDQIKIFLPETLAGLPRTSVSAERNAALGFQVSEARADYSDGTGRNLRLEIDDTGGAQGLVALANWAGVEQEREWSGGYERDYRADGRMVHERWDGTNGTGEYGMIVGERFSVQVSGKAASIDELKAALATGVNVAGLESVASEAKPAN